MTVCSISYLKFMQKGSQDCTKPQKRSLSIIYRKLLLPFIDELQFKVANISQGFRLNLLSLIT